MWFEDQTSADDDSEIWKSEVNKKPVSQVTGVMPILKEHDVVLGERSLTDSSCLETDLKGRQNFMFDFVS